MKVSEVEKKIKESFYEKLQNKGFKKWRFYLLNKDNVNPYILFNSNLFEYGNFFQADFMFHIGFKEIKKINEAIFGSYPKNYSYPTQYTLSQARLCDNKIFGNPDFTISEERDIEFMVGTVMKFMENRGFKMLQEKSTIGGLEQYVNHECDIMYRNNALGLLLAKLLDKEYYGKLVYEYGEEVKEWVSKEKKEEYYKTEEFLKAYTREELMKIGGLTEEDLV